MRFDAAVEIGLAFLTCSALRRCKVVATQLTHWPPCTMPTENVQSSVVMPSIRDDLPRHLADCRTAGGQRGPGMARLPIASRFKRANRVAAGDTPLWTEPGSGHQHIFMARGLRLDEVADRRRADSSSGVNSTRDGSGVVKEGGQLPIASATGSCRPSCRRYRGRKTFVAFAPKRQFLQRAIGWTVRMPGDQDARSPSSDAGAGGERQPAKPCRPAILGGRTLIAMSRAAR